MDSAEPPRREAGLDLPENAAPTGALRRLLGSSLSQAARTPRCPDTPRLDGARAVVTGATGGIGLESGGYWHNVHGRMELAPEDPARDTASAVKLWEICEALAAAGEARGSGRR